MTAAVLTTGPALAQMREVEGVPDGFEVLDKPRATSVSLYYGGDAIGNASAHTTPGKLQFDDPNAVMDLIPAIADRAKVGAVLANPIPANIGAACSASNSENCGELSPDIIGVIFDENTLSAEIFIHKDYLSLQGDDKPRYLPLPERALSSIYMLNGAVNGIQGATPNYSLSGVGTHSFGEIKLTSQSTISNKGLRFDTAAASIDRNGWNGTAGLFRSAPMHLLGDRDIAGVSYGTSSKTRLDNKKSEGNKVIVYLPRRAFVSIYREGRLYSSRSYDAGNQEIDTSELPDGAYNITLRIEEADGTVREETRFFGKTEDIPPVGKPNWFVQGGAIRKTASDDSTVPEITGDPILRGGVMWRAGEKTGLGIEALGTKDRVAVEASAYRLIENGQAQITALTSTKGDMGIAANYIKTGEKFNVAIDARKTWMADEPMDGEIIVGGDQADQSAVIVQTEGDAEGEMKILVNDAERGTIKIGEKRAIYLNPFHSYNIRLVPKEASLTEYESGARRVTLYPGNVIKETWSVNKFYVVVAQIVDTLGQPLANAVLNDKEKDNATDEDGRIQAQVSGSNILDFGNCKVILPAQEPVNGVLVYEQPLVCQ